MRPSQAQSLAARRELLVALATAQRLRLVAEVRSSPLAVRLGWSALALAARVLVAVLVPRAASRLLGQLLVLLRELLQRPG